MISFTLAEAGPTTLELVDAAGRRVSSLRLESAEPGSHTVRLDAIGRVKPGVCFVRVVQNGRSAVAKAMVLR